MRLLCGGAAAPETLIWKLDKFGFHMIHAWGMTETTPLATVNFVKRGLEKFGRRSPVRHTIGARTARHRSSIFGCARAMASLLGTGKQRVNSRSEDRGSLQVTSTTQTPRIAGRTTVGFARAMLRRSIRVATCDSPTESKDLIKSGGEWISSVELESHLMAHPAVREAAVVAVPHPKWLERPLAVIVVREGAKATADELALHLESKVARWWIPDGYVFVDAIPHTSTGKVFKSELRERYKDWSAET